MERSAIFNNEMIRAILAGLKTNTRRVIEPQPDLGKFSAVCGVFVGDPRYAVIWHEMTEMEKFCATHERLAETKRVAYCRYGAPGDVLWAKENWRIVPGSARSWKSESKISIEYKADGTIVETDKPIWDDDWHKWWTMYVKDDSGKWRFSWFMPKWASRLRLEVINISADRLQSISEQDALAEGVEILGRNLPSRVVFAELWDSISKRRGYGWLDNPVVWAIEFKRIADAQARVRLAQV